MDKRKKWVKRRIIKTDIRKGDLVSVITGKEKGKQGKVLEVIYKKGMVVVERVNMVKKAVRPNQEMQQGSIIEIEAPLNISNVNIICPKCNKKTKVSRKEINGKRVRVCKKCNEMIDKV